MFKKLVKKVLWRNKQNKKLVKESGHEFRQKCLQITKQFPILQSSIYFTTHVPLIVQQQQIVPTITKKIDIIQQGIKKNPKLQMQLASIILSVIEQDGLLFMFVKLWASTFCQFQLKKIIQQYQILQKNQKSNKQKQKTQLVDYAKQKGQKIKRFFHKQFFLLCFFIYQLTMYLYSECLQKQQKYQNRQLFLLIRNNITAVRQFSVIHQLIRHNISCQKIIFSDQQIQQNMSDLDKICQISKIPAPFIQSMNLLNQFCKEPDIEKKLKKSTVLVQKIKQEMQEYRKVNQMNNNYIFCADDVLSALIFVMWRLMKNIYGPCIYVETVLCCQYAQISQQRLAEELDRFEQATRHSFDTLKTVAKIGLLAPQMIYSLN